MSQDHLEEIFIGRMQQLFGNESEAFLNSLHQAPQTSIRLNLSKPVALNFPTEPLRWSTIGKRLSERPLFTTDPLLHAGAYYVQEASSMILEYVLQELNLAGKNIAALDLCASPGGKSTHLIDVLGAESLMVSNEISGERNAILRENLARWGSCNVVVTQNSSAAFSALVNEFDLILIDAPCSGEGLIRRDKKALTHWSQANIDMCVMRQREIVSDAVNALKPGGFLIYSTCTFEPDENILNAVNFAHSHSLISIAISNPFPDEITTVIESSVSGLAFFPHRTRGEGFFITVFQKAEAAKPTAYSAHKSKQLFLRVKNDALSGTAAEFLVHPECFQFFQKDDAVYSLPHNVAEFVKRNGTSLNIKTAGVKSINIKGNDLHPVHELALSTAYNKSSHDIPLTLEQAQRYLKCESPPLPPLISGWQTVSFLGLQLGWIKGIGSRYNNYFPRNWRIRMHLD